MTTTFDEELAKVQYRTIETPRCCATCKNLRRVDLPRRITLRYHGQDYYTCALPILCFLGMYARQTWDVVCNQWEEWEE